MQRLIDDADIAQVTIALVGLAVGNRDFHLVRNHPQTAGLLSRALIQFRHVIRMDVQQFNALRQRREAVIETEQLAKRLDVRLNTLDCGTQSALRGKHHALISEVCVALGTVALRLAIRKAHARCIPLGAGKVLLSDGDAGTNDYGLNQACGFFLVHHDATIQFRITSVLGTSSAWGARSCNRTASAYPPFFSSIASIARRMNSARLCSCFFAHSLARALSASGSTICVRFMTLFSFVLESPLCLNTHKK